MGMISLLIPNRNVHFFNVSPSILLLSQWNYAISFLTGDVLLMIAAELKGSVVVWCSSQSYVC